MTDPRYKKLAEVLTDYSTALKKGDTVLFDITDTPEAFAVELVRAARKRGAIPLVETRSGRVGREMLMGTTEPHAKTVRDIELNRMKKCDAYVAVRGSHNATENSDIPSDNLSMYSRTLRP
ncbi:MAG: aminopeptidase, partial [Verrucomicrobia bacterium]|nr:aminopeptidase [Verrucomicrobiota bacterium]